MFRRNLMFVSQIHDRTTAPPLAHPYEHNHQGTPLVNLRFIPCCPLEEQELHMTIKVGGGVREFFNKKREVFTLKSFCLQFGPQPPLSTYCNQ